MKVGTQNQAFFLENVKEKFNYLKKTGFEVFEIVGKFLVDHLDEVKEASAKIGLPVTTAKIIADFYHMNIEEEGISEALHQNRDLVAHIHIANHHLFQPGSGSLDFKKHFDQLKSDGYQSFVTFECRVRGNELEEEYLKALQHTKEALSEKEAIM